MFVLWHAVTNVLDSDWHRSAAAAEAHKVRCGLDDGWRVAQFSVEQQDELYNSRHYRDSDRNS